MLSRSNKFNYKLLNQGSKKGKTIIGKEACKEAVQYHAKNDRYITIVWCCMFACGTIRHSHAPTPTLHDGRDQVAAMQCHAIP